MHSRSIAPLMSSRSPLIRVPSTLDSAVPASQIEFVTGHVVVVAAIPNALSAAALFRRRDLEHSRLPNVVKLVCLLQGFVVEVRRPSMPRPS